MIQEKETPTGFLEALKAGKRAADCVLTCRKETEEVLHEASKALSRNMGVELSMAIKPLSKIAPYEQFLTVTTAIHNSEILNLGRIYKTNDTYPLEFMGNQSLNCLQLSAYSKGEFEALIGGIFQSGAFILKVREMLNGKLAKDCQ